MTNKLLAFGMLPVVAAALCATDAAAASSARFTIRGYVPLVCNASVVSTNVVDGAALRIDAMVSQSCNAKHQMSVRFSADADTGGLSVQYNGASPTVVSPGLRSFGQERFAKAIRQLQITYAGGTPLQRQTLAQTVTIEVSPL